MNSEGAEFLVLGNLLIRGVHATKAYTNFPGWDLLATNPTTADTCRIQVKARLATDFDGGFPIKDFSAEFVVLAALNRGNRYRKASTGHEGQKDPMFWILPMELVVEAAEQAPRWGDSSKVFLRHLSDSQQFLGAWNLISEHLRL